MFENDDSRTDGVSRRSLLRTAGAVAGSLALGGGAVGTAAAKGRSGGRAGENGRGNTGRPEARVTFHDHETDGTSVVAEELFIDAPGFLSIHDRRRWEYLGFQPRERFDASEQDVVDAIVDSLIGITECYDPGKHQGVEVDLFTDPAPTPGPYGRYDAQDASGLTASQPLIAIPHRDPNDSEAFELERNNMMDGAFTDGPSPLPGLAGAVADFATVYVEGDDRATRHAAKREERAVRREFGSRS